MIFPPRVARFLGAVIFGALVIFFVSCETTAGLTDMSDMLDMGAESVPEEIVESIRIEDAGEETEIIAEQKNEDDFAQALISEDDLRQFEAEAAALAEAERLAQEAAEREAAEQEAARLEAERLAQEAAEREAAEQEAARLEAERLANEAAAAAEAERLAQEAAAAKPAPPPAPSAPARPVPATPPAPLPPPVPETRAAEIPDSPPISIPTMTEEENPSPSRTLRVPVNRAFDVKLPGSAWMFVGETEKPNIIRYIKRDNLFNETAFSLLAEKEGRTIIHFYRQDAIANSGQNEYIEVIASADMQQMQETGASSPDGTSASASASASAPARTESAPLAGALPNVQNPPAPSPAASILSLLKSAKDAYAAQDYAKAAALIDEFLDTAEDALDEGLFLKGQIYEAKSPLRDIKTSLAAYNELLRAMPLSPLAKNAKDRIAYIKRFYY
ncbi:MAG: hypothetical protein Ta2A_03850 [Treponemataceae bacterium]|nr:MAG: hypothetical protein Ta2A_03850 [Treponemataceae bacterium]